MQGHFTFETSLPVAGRPDRVAVVRGTLATALQGLHVDVPGVLQGFELAPLLPPASFAKLIRDDLATWPAVIKASGATVD